jgi:YidC/Oxa1 family membrane protein insertase
MQQNRNFLIFLLISFTLFMAVTWTKNHFWPPPKKAVQEEAAKPREEKKAEVALTKPPEQPVVTPDKQLIAIGDASPDSAFHLYLLLDPLGAGVRKIVLNKFQQATSGGLPAGTELALVPSGANLHEPSFLLYHFDPDDTKLDHPLDTLGRAVWKVVKQEGGQDVRVEKVDGKERQSVAFRTEVQGVTVTKTYSLTEGEYHVGLKVDLERPQAGPKAKPAELREVKFRYQLTGAKGLPLEGKWYTTTHRHALLGVQDDRGYLARDFQDLRQISLWGGGNRVETKEGQILRYAAVAVQYFASVIVVDEEQDNQKFLLRAQPTLERALVRGKAKGVALQAADWLVIQSEDGKHQDTIFIPPHLRGELIGVKDGTLVSVIYRPLIFNPEAKQSYKEAMSLHVGDAAGEVHSLLEDDITVRVTTNAVELKPGSKVSHRYLLYNGPVKPSLLGQLTGDKAVAPELVERYANTLQLNTMTDYQSPGGFGAFFRTIGWTWVIIQCTNIMHRVLGWLNMIVASYGLCIILLTVMVRGLMFPLSRKQALMSVKMQALAPELKKLQEKFKDDKQGMAMAQWDLYKKHGVSPLGSCWVLLLQMPIFMGLYYALQESIQFRLAPFWPTWIKNLAAPDMMIRWGESIPLISRPEDFGGFLYLGPYLNILPIIAVTLMIFQQKMMMPPPTDEQQAMQQKMMKWMMVFMGLMFYKVAAGLCIYFIATTLWGFTERKLLPKSKLAPAGPGFGGADGAAAPVPPAGGPNNAARVGEPAASAAHILSGKKQPKNKRKAERGRTAIKEAEPKTGLGRFMKRVSDWWSDVLEQARKK